MTIRDAAKIAIEQDVYITRACWPVKWIEIKRMDNKNATAFGSQHIFRWEDFPWTPSADDVLADDWMVVRDISIRSGTRTEPSKSSPALAGEPDTRWMPILAVGLSLVSFVIATIALLLRG